MLSHQNTSNKRKNRKKEEEGRRERGGGGRESKKKEKKIKSITQRTSEEMTIERTTNEQNHTNSVIIE